MTAKERLYKIYWTQERVKDIFPEVKKIIVDVSTQYNVFTGEVYKDNYIKTFESNDAAFFVIDCPNSDCTVGGINFHCVVSDAIAHNQTEISVNIECPGYENKHPNERCHTTYILKLRIQY